MLTIREIREERGLSQQELASLAGMSAATISRIENGREVLKPTLIALCSVLGVPVSEVSGVVIVNRILNRRARG